MIKRIKLMFMEWKRTKNCIYYKAYKTRDKNGRYCAGRWSPKLTNFMMPSNLHDICTDCPFRVKFVKGVKNDV